MLQSLLKLGWVAGAVLLAGTSAVAARPFAIDPQASRIEAHARATAHDFTSRLKAYEAVIELTPEGTSVQAARLAFRFADLDSDNADRDAEMLRWIGDAPATGQFTLQQVRAGANGTWIGTGELTLWNHRQVVEIPFRLGQEAGRTHLRGELSLDYTTYGLPKIRKFAFLTVFPTLQIEFDLVEKAQP